MSDQRDGGIAWTDHSWNPVRGCSRVSSGCTRCYAEVVAGRFCGPGQPYEGLARRTPAGPQWTGEVRLVPEHLADPLRWKRPRRVFVNSMSDLFHEQLPDEAIDQVFAVMMRAPQHTFQILTKRPDRMAKYTAASYVPGGILVALDKSNSIGEVDHEWPPRNVWLGTSIEDQRTADARLSKLRQCLAAIRFVSAEPLLEAVDVRPYLQRTEGCEMGIGWLIIGGESGTGARPFDLAWGRSLISQCKAAGVPVFMKQLGSLAVFNEPGIPGKDSPELNHWAMGPAGIQAKLRDRKGGDPAEWPEDLRVREFPR